MQKLACCAATLLVVVHSGAMAADINAVCDVEAEARTAAGMQSDEATRSQCQCAIAKVREASSDKEFDVYSEVGMAYFKNLSGGMSRQEAWMAAANSVGEARGMSGTEVLMATRSQSEIHEKAMADCN